MFDNNLLSRSRAYVEATATPRAALAAASGVSERDLEAIEAARALPAPTYLVFEDAIHSPIRTLGEPRSEGGDAFYCPAVLHWVRRARLLGTDRPDLLDRLQEWFTDDFTTELQVQANEAREFAWRHLFDADGAMAPEKLAAEASTLCTDWMDGGWAVCLRRWNGYHVVTKDLERARISALTGDAARELNDAERCALFDAIERLDSVMLPFSPHERPHGTPGLFIDRMRARYGV